jgi:predicted lysophospholipase L1 biosynthesis ABC-type transport system permease subunit
MGLRLVFHDGGWLGMASGFATATRLSAIKVTLLAVAAAVAAGFVVYLFIARKKKEFAVMRALGTPRGAAAKSLALPLLALAVMSLLFGRAAAAVYTDKTIAGSSGLSALEGLAVNTAVPVPVAVGCIFGMVLLTLLFTLVLLRRIGSISPLALLQDGGKRRAGGKKA